MFKGLLRAFGVPLITLIILLMVAAAQAQPAHQHPPRDAEVHEKFYMGWDRPDFPGNNCCKRTDCYVTAIKRVGTDHYALTRTMVKDEKTGVATSEYVLNDPKDPENWVLIPPERLEQNQVPGRKAFSNVDNNEYTMREPLDSPDGRSHVCMIETLAGVDAPGFSPAGRWFVLCAVLGEAS
jgi:hypothetical protein